MNEELRPVTLAEQEALGLRRPTQPNRLVVPERQAILPPATVNHATALDVPMSAQQLVEVRTSEVDRSAGYLLRTIPLSVAFAIVATIAGISLAGRPFFSWSAFVLFWLSFVGAWMYGEYRHGKSSPNAVALREVERKWNNIDANDQRRWDAWEKATGLVTPKVRLRSEELWEQYKLIAVAWGICTLIWVAIVIVMMIRGPQ